jgi:hypothetical protein
MADIKSELGTKTFQSGNGMKQFEIEDASYNDGDQSQSSLQNIADLERKVQEAKRARSNGKERLSETAKRRIEMLCGMSRMDKEVEIDGNIYSLRTLKSKEIQEAINICIKYDGSVDLSFETRKQFLARSLYKVANTDISDFLNDNSIEARLEFFDCMEESVLSRLYSEYTKLVAESDLKYSIRKESELKELVEDLKK